MEQLEKNIYAMEVPLKDSPLKTIHCYLIKGDARNLLIDTAFNQDDAYSAILDGMAEAGATPDNTDIFITHLHVDHCGLIHRLKRPTNTIYTGADYDQIVDYFNSDRNWDFVAQFSHIAGIPSAGGIGSDQHVSYLNKPDEQVEMTRLYEGDTIQAGGYTFSLIDLPGHTPGQSGLWDAEHGFLFSGDHILAKITPNIAAWDFDTDYLAIFCDSLRKVRGMPVKRLFPAHRSRPEDVTGRIDELLEHHRVRLDNMLRVLKEAPGPVSAFYVAMRIEWNIRKELLDLSAHQQWFACSETVAHLQHMVFENRVGFTDSAEGVRLYFPK